MVNKQAYESSKAKALEFSYQLSLPDLDNGTDVWFKAILKVTKVDMSESYAIGYKDALGNMSIKADFGTTSKIYSVDEVRPYSFLKTEYMRPFKTKIEIMDYLKRQSDYVGMDFSKLDKATIENLVNYALYKEQLRAEKLL